MVGVRANIRNLQILSGYGASSRVATYIAVVPNRCRLIAGSSLPPSPGQQMPNIQRPQRVAEFMNRTVTLAIQIWYSCYVDFVVGRIAKDNGWMRYSDLLY